MRPALVVTMVLAGCAARAEPRLRHPVAAPASGPRFGVRWRIAPPTTDPLAMDSLPARAVVAGDVVVTSADDGRAVVYDLATGAIRLRGALPAGRMVAAGGRVNVATADHELAFDPHTLALRWQVPGGGVLHSSEPWILDGDPH